MPRTYTPLRSPTLRDPAHERGSVAGNGQAYRQNHLGRLPKMRRAAQSQLLRQKQTLERCLVSRLLLERDQLTCQAEQEAEASPMKLHFETRPAGRECFFCGNRLMFVEETRLRIGCAIGCATCQVFVCTGSKVVLADRLWISNA